ncbi:MAG: alpha-L-fucosidase [Bacteroidales bacterium]|nr:alpha-L-fucosidase [Bacteroidales bacterium]
MHVMNRIIFALLTVILSSIQLYAQHFPTPTKDQTALQDMEMYAFIHYSLNTYTDQEWGFGNEDPQLFNPSHLDTRQWVRTCKAAGMRGIIFTAKHHCGFCMWPSAYTDYSVKNAPWKDGKGDVVRELADACREYGLKFAVYLSPWDRNHPEYGRPAYVTYFRNQLRELLTQYGDIFEVWFDGANGGNGWYGGANETRQIDRLTYYQWDGTYDMIRQLQPHCIIWNDGANRRGDLRWVGTEAGYVGETNWSMLHSTGNVPRADLHYGAEDGDVWVPGETNTSIRPGWFYHDAENGRVKSLEKLMETYYKSVGRNSTLLLNFPVDKDGLIHTEDSLRGEEFNKMIHSIFDHPIKGRQKLDTSVSTLTFKQPVDFNRLMLCEDLSKGQDVKKFKVEAFVEESSIDGQTFGHWQELKDIISEEPERSMTTIGRKRILCFPTTRTKQIRVTIIDRRSNFRNCKRLRHISAYLAPAIGNDNPTTDKKHVTQYRIRHVENGTTLQSLLIDLGKVTNVKTFRFLPNQSSREGTPLNYTLMGSSDGGKTWVQLAKGEFSNIVNNPIWQTVQCQPTKVRLLRLDCDRITSGQRILYSDIEVIAE